MGWLGKIYPAFSPVYDAERFGALANDVGFGLANAHAQRIRERLLRLNDSVELDRETA